MGASSSNGVSDMGEDLLCRQGRLFDAWTAGIRFDTNLAYHTHRGSLAAYLVALAEAEDAAKRGAA